MVLMNLKTALIVDKLPKISSDVHMNSIIRMVERAIPSLFLMLLHTSCIWRNTMERNKCPMDDIIYRKNLLEKRKLTESEKVWLQTHTVYSEEFGYPFIRAMAIHIKPDTIYSLTVRFIRKTALQRVTPTIFIPMGKGYLLSDGETIDQTGKIYHRKKATMLSTNNDEKNPELMVNLLSETGVFCVFFHAIILQNKLLDSRFKALPPTKHLMPSTMIPYFCMNYTEICANKFRFSCSISKEKFSDDYEFEIEWTAQ